MCKTPAPGKSKTRLSPPLRPEECAAISACFIQDLSRTIDDARRAMATSPATPSTRRSARKRRCARLLPDGFQLTPQSEGDFGERLLQGTQRSARCGPRRRDPGQFRQSDACRASILRAAVDAVRARRQRRAQSGVRRRLHADRPVEAARAGCSRTFPGAPSAVYRLTLERAREIGLPVVERARLVRRRRCRLVADAGGRVGGPAACLLRPLRAPTRRPPAASCASARLLSAEPRALAPEATRCCCPPAIDRVAVVIPCLNEAEPIAGVVREVLAQGVDDVIVVDNGSTDDTAAQAAAAGAHGRARAAARLWPRLRRRRCRGAAGHRDRLLPRWRRQRRAAFPAGRRRPGRRGRGRFRHGLAAARQARSRQHDAAADRRRLARRACCCG